MSTRHPPFPSLLLTVLLSVAAIQPPCATADAICTGDCNGDGVVTVDEVVRGVRIALGGAPLADCPAADADGSGMVTIGDLVGAVGAALDGCRSPSTPTPTPRPDRCGDGVLEDGETCDTCPVDCTVLACTPGAPIQTFSVELQAPDSVPVARVSVLVGYRSDRVDLPTDPASRVQNRHAGTAVLADDLGYALQVSVNTHPGTSLSSGQLFAVDFDTCSGQSPVAAADFGCQVETCEQTFGSIAGCTCAVAP
jgi:hypothetical protein